MNNLLWTLSFLAFLTSQLAFSADPLPKKPISAAMKKRIQELDKQLHHSSKETTEGENARTESEQRDEGSEANLNKTLQHAKRAKPPTRKRPTRTGFQSAESAPPESEETSTAKDEAEGDEPKKHVKRSSDPKSKPKPTSNANKVAKAKKGARFTANKANCDLLVSNLQGVDNEAITEKAMGQLSQCGEFGSKGALHRLTVFHEKSNNTEKADYWNGVLEKKYNDGTLN